MRKPVAALVVTLFLIAVAPVAAQQSTQGSAVGSGIGLRGWGVRVGLGVDPDQALVGIHWDLGEFIPQLRFQPDIELGVGDDALTFYATAPVHYLFRVNADFTPYAGGGIALGVVNVDLPEQAQGDEDETSFEAGARAIGGLEWTLKNGNPFAIEANFGVGDVHDFQVKVLWTF